MASVDGSNSLRFASDAIFDFMCGPCKTNDGIIKEAKQYCGDCSEYLCDSCVAYHKKLPSLKSHKIVGSDQTPVGTGRRLTVYCRCNKSKEVEFYCGDHADVICGPCKSFNHHHCNTSPIQQKSSGYTTANLESIISRTKSLKSKYEQLKQICKDNKNELKTSSESCIRKIRAFRKELDSFLEKLEQKMLAELIRLETEECQKIDRQISTLTSALQMLDADSKILEDAKKDGRKEVMFASDIQTAKGLQGYSSRLADFENDAKKLTISFEKNDKLNNMQNSITTLGSLKISESDDKRKTVLLGQHIGSRREVNIRLADDKKTPWITGCTVMPNDYVVVCDSYNSKVKLLDSSLVVTDSCVVRDKPWDGSVFDTNNVIVTIPDKKQLQLVQVFSQLKVGRVIQLDKKCWGVEVSGDKVYVSCHNNPGEGEVRVLDKNGNLERRLQDGSYIFSSPSYITVSRGSSKIFVSDSNNDTITCMKMDGNILYQYKDKDLRGPHGIFCDDSDTILVCCSGSHSVKVITAEGKLYNTILSSKDGLQRPYSVTYRQRDNILVIGCSGLDHLLVYHLTQ